jgi:hypothetical protein
MNSVTGKQLFRPILLKQLKPIHALGLGGLRAIITNQVVSALLDIEERGSRCRCVE